MDPASIRKPVDPAPDTNYDSAKDSKSQDNIGNKPKEPAIDTSSDSKNGSSVDQQDGDKNGADD
jgi:hypothetical protein